jgi:superfamily I DNA and/or RNA helicase
MSTIDRYQGRDKSVILISLVRSNEKGRVGRLLSDFRRINVALSRAKTKLIIIGSLQTMSRGSEVLRPVLAHIQQAHGIVHPPLELLSPPTPTMTPA